MPKIIPPAAFLHECLTYNANTGALIWKSRPRRHFHSYHAWICWNARFPGKVAGSPDARDYIIICIDDIRYKAHRVIWMMQTGEQPPPLMDHRKRGPTENRWKNLRAATPQQNSFNQRKRSDQRLSKGVCIQDGRHRATAGLRGRKVSLGMYDTSDEAHAAWHDFASKHHGEFFNDGGDDDHRK